MPRVTLKVHYAVIFDVSGENMMVKEGDYVAVFNSIHRVMKAEKLLKERQLDILLIPAPRAVSSDCGLAIRYDETIRDLVESLLLSTALQPAETYLKRGEEYIRVDKGNA